MTYIYISISTAVVTFLPVFPETVFSWRSWRSRAIRTLTLVEVYSLYTLF